MIMKINRKVFSNILVILWAGLIFLCPVWIQMLLKNIRNY